MKVLYLDSGHYGPLHGMIHDMNGYQYFYWSEDTEAGIRLFNTVHMRRWEVRYERWKLSLIHRMAKMKEGFKKTLMMGAILALPDFHYDNRDTIETITEEQLMFARKVSGESF